jgi:DNA-binding transcriptional LysR family regulator
MVAADLDAGALVKVRVEDVPRELVMPMKLVYRKDSPPGPAAREFIAELRR